MDVHDIDQDEECKYFLNTFENIEKQEFPLLLMEMLEEPVETILKLINKIRMKINDISTDKVPNVRKFFLEYIPNILIKLRAVNNQQLNEYLYEYLVDTIFGQFFSEEVIFRQLARKIILHLLDRHLLTEAAVEQCVQNVLKSHANDDLPIFMFYIAPVLGAEQTKKYFWKIFLEVIEGDPGSGVRKQCVRLVAILGSILGQEITERDLLPIFVKLSKTSEWTIRKECAMELPKISVLCSRQSREQILTPVMEELLTDANKWVHTAAAEKLGIYIATFAQPEILTLAINQEGELYVVNVADENENYREMLSEEKLKNFQFYQDMFAETLIPTSAADLGRSFGSFPNGKLFSSSSPVYQQDSSLGPTTSSKTIICDSAWYNSVSPANPFVASGMEESEKLVTERMLEKPLLSPLEKKRASLTGIEKETPLVEGGGGGGGVDNPYQKFVHPNFLINLSSFIMNTQAAAAASSPSSSSASSGTTPPSPTNPFHSLPPLLSMKKLAGSSDRDFDYHNLYQQQKKNNATVSNLNKIGNVQKRDKEQEEEDSNGNKVAATTEEVESAKPDDVVNNNNDRNSKGTTNEGGEQEGPMDNNNKRDVMQSAADGEDKNNNREDEEPMGSSQLERELAKLSLNEQEQQQQEEEDRRTSAHLKRATPEGLPHVIKMAIKDKTTKKKGLKGLTLPSAGVAPLQILTGACVEGNVVKTNEDDDNKNNNASEENLDSQEEQEDDSPPQTPSIEDAPTACPFGGSSSISKGAIEKDDDSVKTPETARIMDPLEEQKDLFAAAGDGIAKKSEGVEEGEEFCTYNYWYVKPPELTVDELEWIEKSERAETERQQEQQQRKEEENLPPPPPPPEDEDDDDDDEEEEDFPEPMEKRRLFSLYSMKSYKLGEDSSSGLMSSSMKASRDELLDNLFSNDQSHQSSHLMMVKKSDINPQLSNQRVLPPILLHFFLEMSNFPEWDQICAYSFPAVVLTMGKSHWPLLKGQLQTLCCAIRWEVRQIVVASIYQIALIIGREYASQDLVPVFLGFFKDLDNVKIEALHNVAKFLQVIDKRRHIEVVAHLGECLEPENVTNWRFRKDLAQEIVKLMEIYKSDQEEHALASATAGEASSSPPQDDLTVINEECLKYLTGYALRLLMDRVHCVREVAMDAIISRMRLSTEAQLLDLIGIVITAFAKSSHWRRRQIFGQLCEMLLEKEAIAMAEFEEKLLPALIAMAEDKVPNVRLVVAKCLYKCAQSAYFMESLERRLKLEVILRQLENDSDRDVRASTNVSVSGDDSRMDESLETNRTSYLDETIECEPSGSVPEVVVVAEEEEQEKQPAEEVEAGGEEKAREESEEKLP